jgi:hypothetical protein
MLVNRALRSYVVVFAPVGEKQLMRDPRLSEIAEHLKELAIEDRRVAAFCISMANEFLGRECQDKEDQTDAEWWRTHDEQLASILKEVVRQMANE